MAKLAEIWPATASNGGLYERARAVVYQGDGFPAPPPMLAIWGEHNRKPRLLVHAAIISWDPGPPHVFAVEGETWTVKPGGGCGCGSPLRGLNWQRELGALV